MQSTDTTNEEYPEVRLLSDMASGREHQQEEGHGKWERPHYRQGELATQVDLWRSPRQER